LINIRTDRKSQPGKFPWTEALRILSFFTSQSSPDKASLALGIIPLACLEESCYVEQLHTSKAKQNKSYNNIVLPLVEHLMMNLDQHLSKGVQGVLLPLLPQPTKFKILKEQK